MFDQKSAEYDLDQNIHEGALIMTWFWPFLYLLGRKLNCHNIFSNNIGDNVGQMFRWHCLVSRIHIFKDTYVLIIGESRQKPDIFEIFEKFPVCHMI